MSREDARGHLSVVTSGGVVAPQTAGAKIVQIVVPSGSDEKAWNEAIKRAEDVLDKAGVNGPR